MKDEINISYEDYKGFKAAYDKILDRKTGELNKFDLIISEIDNFIEKIEEIKR